MELTTLPRTSDGILSAIEFSKDTLEPKNTHTPNFYYSLAGYYDI